MNATSIKQLIQQLVQPQLPELAEGIVTNTDPLEITLVNDVKISLHAVSLTIPGRLQPLQKGERLYLLSFRDGNMNYVLDRV